MLLSFIIFGCDMESSDRKDVPHQVCMFFSASSDDLNADRLRRLLIREMANRGVNISVNCMYLSCEPGPDTQSQITRFLDSIATRSPEIVVVSGDQAFQQIMKNHHPSLFKLPIVVGGVRFLREQMIAEHHNVCGFTDTPDYFRLFGLIYTTLGKIPVEMGRDTTIYARKACCELYRQMRNTDVKLKKEKVNSRALYRPSYDSLMVFSYPFCQMDGQQMYLHFVDTHKSTNEVFLADRVDGATLGLCSYSNMPIFTTAYELFNYRFNVVGGVFATVEQSARELAECAIKVMSGVSPSSLGFIKSHKDVVIDYKRYRKAGFDLSRVPKGTIFVNRPLIDFHDSTFFWIFGAVVLFAVTGVTLFYFYYNHRHNRTYIEGIRKEHERLLDALFPNSRCFIMRAGKLLFDEHIEKGINIKKDNRLCLLDEFLEKVHPKDLNLLEFLRQDNSPIDFRSVAFRMAMENDKYDWYRVDCRSASRGRERYIAGVITSIDEQKQQELRKERIRTKAQAELKLRDEFIESSVKVAELLMSLHMLTMKLHGKLVSDETRADLQTQFEAQKSQLLEILDNMSEKK